MEVRKPNTHPLTINPMSVFLAGSIEMGLAENWQKRAEEALKAYDKMVVYNPRREDWDSSWEQDQTNKEFNDQVNWELDRIEESDWVFMYLDPKTKSPITLLELGYFRTSGKLVVVCPPGFYRKGNVDIVCVRNNIPLFEDFDKGFGAFMTKLKMVKH